MIMMIVLIFHRLQKDDCIFAVLKVTLRNPIVNATTSKTKYP